MTISFGEQLSTALTTYGPLCVGIDPHDALLDTWGLRRDAASVREFGLRVVEAAAERAGMVKPQVAFFERFGSAGFAALEEVLAAAREAGLLIVADAKRGDIGSTMDGYAQAWLGEGSTLESDSVTLSPYLGVGALEPTLKAAMELGKGAFVLAATSNPEAASLQRASTLDGQEGENVAIRVAREVAELNRLRHAEGELGSIGVVIGATNDLAAFGLTADVLQGTPILAPGFGAQGATAKDLVRVFGHVASQVLACESRSILGSGPGGLAAAIAAAQSQYLEVLRD